MLENYQTEHGINVPEVLRKYIPGQPKFLPYTKELPKDSISARGAKTSASTELPGKVKDLQIAKKDP